MSECLRFEQEGLAAVQAGEPLDTHFSSCDTCRDALARYERLTRALKETGPTQTPPVGWQNPVRQRIAIPAPQQQTRTRWTVAAAGLAAAVCIALLLAPRLQEPLSLQAEVQHNPMMTQRSIGAQQGDTWKLSGRVGHAEHADLRIYLDGDLLAHCNGGLDCRHDGSRLEAEYVVERLGTYEALIVRAEVPLPPLAGNPSDDRDAVEATGGEIAAAEPIELR